jgi:hypothetical protein
LRLAEDLDKVADANFLRSHKIQEPQASVVAQSLKEAFQAEFCFAAISTIYLR